MIEGTKSETRAERAASRAPLPEDGRRRAVVERVSPEVDGGRFPVKRVVGERVIVEADAFADGHDALRCVLLYRREGDLTADQPTWSEIDMRPIANDRWQGAFGVDAVGRYRYAVQAWVDSFVTWRQDLAKKVDAGQDVSVELLIGARLVAEAAARAADEDASRLQRWATTLSTRSSEGYRERVSLALSGVLDEAMARHPDRQLATTHDPGLFAVVDPVRARFSSWYELFPRSCSPTPERHGTLRDCIARLPYVARMGFDVLYLPPIHPIGQSYRKGRNNAPTAQPGDPGSPWAIGSAEGGHKSVNPALGTLDDFRELVVRAQEQGIEVALDVAFQCSPDHPYVSEHPEWFRWRPDGTIQYAENPPKKYQDIYPFDFETPHWRELWEELKSVVLFWVDQGVRIFRVDNPHTKPFRFWEWLIGEVKRERPEAIFLSEAFTRPKVMYQLAKLGFTQSYTYFTWRNTKHELASYLTDLTRSEVAEYFRPNLWPNTPDILPAYLQYGGRPAFVTRLILAATLGASYGVYGPAFELAENRARMPGSEEYLDSEKYEVRLWNLESPDSLADLIARVNRVRRQHPALQSNHGLQFHRVDNEQLIAYSKSVEDGSDTILVVVNLDPHHTQSGWLELPLADLKLDPRQSYQVHELLTDAYYLWQGPRNYVELDPRVVPANVFLLRKRVRTERDFEYFT